jgi:hypothetical protein
VKRRAALLPVLAAAALAGFAGLTRARAEPLDPTLPLYFAVGDPPGAAPMEGVDAARSGRARAPLPRRPRVLWRARVPGSVDAPLLVDAQGNVLAFGNPPHLSQLDVRGQLLWSARLSMTPASAVLTSDGSRVVLGTLGQLAYFDAKGNVTSRQTLRLPVIGSLAHPLPLDDGGLALAVGGAVLRLDAGGEVVARSVVDDDVRTLLRDRAALLLVTARGDVLEWKPPHEPVARGSFGGKVDGAALSAPGRVLAVVDRTRLIELKLATGTRHVRFPDGPLILRGPPAIAPASASRVASVDGLLLGHDASGRETLRVPLEPTALGPADAGAAGLPGRAAPPLLTDAEGRVAFVRAGLDAGVVSSDGEMASAAGAACSDPVALAPAGARRMLVACRSGLIWLIGD